MSTTKSHSEVSSDALCEFSFSFVPKDKDDKKMASRDTVCQILKETREKGWKDRVVMFAIGVDQIFFLGESKSEEEIVWLKNLLQKNCFEQSGDYFPEKPPVSTMKAKYNGVRRYPPDFMQ